MLRVPWIWLANLVNRSLLALNGATDLYIWQAVGGKSTAKPGDRLRLAINQYYGYQHDESLVNFRKIKGPQKETVAKIEYLELTKKKGLAALRGAMTFDREHPHDPRTHYPLWSLEELKEVGGAEQKRISKSMETLITRKANLLRAQPQDIENRLNQVYLHQIYAKLLWQWGDKAKARKVTDTGITNMRAMANTEELRESEGQRVYLAALSNNIGDIEEAAKIHQRSVEKDPKNFAFEYLNASYLAGSKNYDKALEQLKKSEAKAKGKQWIQVKKLQIDLLIKTERFKEARAEVERQLRVVNLPEAASARVHSFVSDLRDFQGQLKDKM